MARCRLMIFVALLSVCFPAFAQEANTKEKTESPAADSTQADDSKKSLMSLIPNLPNYSSDLWSRDALTGDWGGTRTELAEHGIIFDLDVTQIFQGNAHGGAETDNGFRYSGSADYTLKLDTARMGLWPAGLLIVKGETMFGKSINGKVGSLMPPNADALFPVPDDPGMTTLTDLYFTQFFNEYFGIVFGKIDFRGGDQNVFAHDENTQFMNLGLLANPVLLSYAPYSSLTAGVFFKPTDWLAGSVLVLDSLGRPDTPGFDTAFHSPEGTTVITEWDITIRPFGLPGHQRFGFAYSNKDFTQLDQDLRIGGPISLLRSLREVLTDPETRPDDWAFYYNFDQYVYTEKEDPTQGVGLFGRFGWSSGETNPFSEFYSIGVGGKGIIPTRDNDTFGIGYYYLNLSDDLPSFLDLSSEQGVELFYNYEVSPWMHISPDLQVIIDPGGDSDNDVAIVYGLRMHMSF